MSVSRVGRLELLSPCLKTEDLARRREQSRHAMASKVFIQTVLPHHSKLIPPFGRASTKKMRIAARIVPASRAAERM